MRQFISSGNSLPSIKSPPRSYSKFSWSISARIEPESLVSTIVQIRGQVCAARGAHADRSIRARERSRRSIHASRPWLSSPLSATAARRLPVPDALPVPRVRIRDVQPAGGKSRVQQLQQHDVHSARDVRHVAVAEAQSACFHGRIWCGSRRRRCRDDHDVRQRQPSRVRESSRLLRRSVRKRQSLLPDEKVPATWNTAGDTHADFFMVSTCAERREFERPFPSLRTFGTVASNICSRRSLGFTVNSIENLVLIKMRK